jgi:hypothetical protein
MLLTDVALVISIANGFGALILTIGSIGDRYRQGRAQRPKRSG